MKEAPVVLSCGCVYDPNLEGKQDLKHFPDGRPTYNNVFTQGRCREIGDAAALFRSPEADADFLKMSNNHKREIREYRRRSSERSTS